jgi:signal transduction histidine kinase
LTNILKHAGADEVHLQIKAGPQTLEINIADNGKGFDTTTADADGRRNGLGNMKRRAEAVGGKLALTSSPGQGSRMELSVSFPS